MSSVKYIAIAALILFGVVLALIGILSVTHDTPVKSVIAEGDKGGPPSITDPLFARSIELFTGAHIEPGNNVQILLDGNRRNKPSRCRCTTPSRAQSPTQWRST